MDSINDNVLEANLMPVNTVDWKTCLYLLVQFLKVLWNFLV